MWGSGGKLERMGLHCKFEFVCCSSECPSVLIWFDIEYFLRKIKTLKITL